MNFWRKALAVFAVNKEKTQDEGLGWRDAAEQAKRDWLYAHQFYENLSDGELIDYAIYMILAAESRYVYVLRKIKKCEGYPGGQDKESDKSFFVYYNRV